MREPGYDSQRVCQCGCHDVEAERAMQIALDHEAKRERRPKRVDKPETKGPNDKGIDIRSKGRTIEVKSGRADQFISDAHANDFDADLNLIADYLYLVRFEDEEEVGFFTLSREEVGQYRQDHKRIEKVSFANRLGTDLRNGVFPNRLNKGS